MDKKEGKSSAPARPLKILREQKFQVTINVLLLLRDQDRFFFVNGRLYSVFVRPVGSSNWHAIPLLGLPESGIANEPVASTAFIYPSSPWCLGSPIEIEHWRKKEKTPQAFWDI